MIELEGIEERAGHVTRMPVVFFGHGSPMNALAHNKYSEVWHEIGRSVPVPRTILSVSAHWYTSGTAVTAADKPRTIHDFGRFPQALFDIQYPAPGGPKLADRVRELLAPLDVTLDTSWGLDHGTWSVLIHAFPEANVPVIQLSIDATRPPAFHYELGKRLAPLRDEGVLIIGSGNVIHNLRLINWNTGAAPFAWADRFNRRVRDHLVRRDHGPLISYEDMGEDARLSIPTPDHWLPLLYIASLHDDEPMEFAVDGIEHGSIGMLTIVFGTRRMS